MTTTDHLDAIAHDWRPWAVDDRAAVLAAVEAAAAANNGLVHAATVRQHLERDVSPYVIGAVICALVRQHVLVGTGQLAPNGGTHSRNRTKPSEIRRLARPLPSAA